MNKKTKRMAYISLLLAMAVLLHYIESLIPIPFPVPGVKLGFANIMGLITYFMFGFKVMIGVNITRVILATLMNGTFLGFAFYVSMGGVCLSTLMVIICGYKNRFSVMMLSIISSLMHCIGQLVVAYFLYGRAMMVFYYLPVMLLLSIPTGIFTGYLANIVINRLKKNFGKDI